MSKLCTLELCTLELCVEVWRCGIWCFEFYVGVLHFTTPCLEFQIEVVRFELCIKAFKLNGLNKSSNFDTLMFWALHFKLSCSSLSSYLTFFLCEILHLCNRGSIFPYHNIHFWSMPLTSLYNFFIYRWVWRVLKRFQNGLRLSLIFKYKGNSNVNGWCWFQFWCSMCTTLLVLILWFILQ
jgi:hypothetical protein